MFFYQTKKSLSVLTIVLLLILFNSCSRTTYYIVRHAEKATASANMSSDVPLSAKGNDRANKLLELLQNKNIGHIFSTQTIRTTSTAKPLSDAINIPIEIYKSVDTVFVHRLKAIQTKNILVVGHSNTVDDLVNKLTGKQLLKDLPDSSYNNLYIIKKACKKYKFTAKKYEPVL